ncbi:MAG TPA: IPT/TIG domain-containing protein [Gemmatimonadaceae bacterium]|nr:IPT/TIG domain-containing protein [Gemmatimonadaceae bacterium]
MGPSFSTAAPLAPSITAITPANGPTTGGNSVTITGANFGTSPAVTFGLATATVTSATATSIVVTAPPGEGPVTVVVTANAMVSNGVSYAYDPPTLTSITPASGPAAGGTTVELNGTNFGLTPTVLFGPFNATIVSHTHTQITITTPPGSAGSSVFVFVAVASQLSNPLMFTYTAAAPAPAIAAITPAHGPTAGGTSVTISGTNFGSSPTVTFGSAVATVISANATAITVTSPPGEGTVPVVITSGTLQSNSVSYAYDAPALSALSPASGPAAGGTSVDLTGINFGLNPTVTFGGVAATVVSHTHTTITVTSPAGTPGASVPVIVTVAGQASNALSFTYDSPVIAAITPSHGPTTGGTSVTISGTNFGASPTVRFGAQIAPVTSATATSIVVTSPPGEGTVPVVVTAGSAQSAPVSFAYDAPALTAITPASGPAAGGTSVDLTGIDFGLNPTVTFGGVAATVVSHTHTLITVTSPAGTAGASVLVVVTVAGQASNSLSFAYTGTPSIVALTPAHGPTTGGTSVTISGTNFGASPMVTFDGQIAPVSSATATSIVVTAPAGEGAVPVVVTSGTLQSNAVTYTYDAPAISAITPASGPAAGGTSVDLTGTNFGLNPTVTFGGVAAPVISHTHTLITVTSPAGTAGSSVSVVVTVARQASNSVAFQYVCPAGTTQSGGSCVPDQQTTSQLIGQLRSLGDGLPHGARGSLREVLDKWHDYQESQRQESTHRDDDGRRSDRGRPNRDDHAGESGRVQRMFCKSLDNFQATVTALGRAHRIDAASVAAIQALLDQIRGNVGC